MKESQNDEENMNVECPQCSRAIEIPSNIWGMKGRCPGCGEIFTVGEVNKIQGNDRSYREKDESCQSGANNNSSMVFCRGCSNELHESARSCPQCGAMQKVSTTKKNKVVAGLLALFLGGFGIHRFYLGQWSGILYILFCWTFIPQLIALVEGIQFLCMSQEEWDEKYADTGH